MHRFSRGKKSASSSRVIILRVQEIGQCTKSMVYVEGKDTAGHGHHWWANPHRVRQRQTGHSTKTGRDGTGQDRTRQDRLSLGIRTVNPGFYSPGIEVYSVLSRPRPCAPYPFAYVCLSYVQPSYGKTFAYLRFSTRCVGRRGWGARRKAAPSSSLSPSFLPPFAAHLLSVESSSISRLGPSSFASLSAKRDLREKRAVYPDLPPDISSTPPYYSPRVFFVLSSINRLSGELNLSNGPALSNAPT